MSIPLQKSESYQIFNSIAKRYDFVNSVLSFGLHHGWRKLMRRSLPRRPELRVLDLATGTGDVALELVNNPSVTAVTGVDLSEGMLHIGRAKVAERGLQDKVTLAVGDAQRLQFVDESFNATTMAFGIRNVPDAVACLKECYRVLKPGGRTLVLEFGLPKSRLVRAVHLFYLRHILPVLGKMLSGHGFAYEYLNKTIEDFPYGEDFLDLMRKAGFKSVGYRPLTLGIVNLYWGDKH